VDQRQVVGLPLRAQLIDAREVRRVASGEIATQGRPAGLEQVIEWAGTPPLRSLATLARPPVLDDRALVRRGGPAPAEDAALVDRVQRVDEDEGARERQPGGGRSLAKAVQQVQLGRPREPCGRNPGPISIADDPSYGGAPNCRRQVNS
jgi:hypothetical protein